MDDKNRKTEETLHGLVDLLNQALRIEYTLIIHYPRIANLIRDEETRKLANELGAASIYHADVVSNIITKLGGKPDWSFELFPEGVGIKKIFQNQLARERLALQLHRGSAELMSSSPHSGALSNLAREEEQHIKIVEQILSKLNNHLLFHILSYLRLFSFLFVNLL